MPRPVIDRTAASTRPAYPASYAHIEGSQNASDSLRRMIDAPQSYIRPMSASLIA